MRKRFIIGLAAGLPAVCLLYFFENNTGTRIVLACAALLPFLPALRRLLTGRAAAAGRPPVLSRTLRDFADREEEDTGGVRAWLPGDSFGRVHW